MYNLKPLRESIKMLLNVQISTKANKVIGWPKRQTLVGVIIALPFFSSHNIPVKIQIMLGWTLKGKFYKNDN